jgi:hypothetical protein
MSCRDSVIDSVISRQILQGILSIGQMDALIKDDGLFGRQRWED